MLGLWALIGLGIGILIPNQVAALLIGIGVAWIVEPLLGFAMTFWEFGREHIAQFLPSSATNAVINAVPEQPRRGPARVVGRPPSCWPPTPPCSPGSASGAPPGPTSAEPRTGGH